jgi:hypothetical protein
MNINLDQRSKKALKLGFAGLLVIIFAMIAAAIHIAESKAASVSFGFG